MPTACPTRLQILETPETLEKTEEGVVHAFMEARYYDPAFGRFLSEDPAFLNLEFDLADPQSLNSYAYARNNPLLYIDPNGESFQTFADAFLQHGTNITMGLAVGAAIGAAVVASPVIAAGAAAVGAVGLAYGTGVMIADGVRSASQLSKGPINLGEASREFSASYNNMSPDQRHAMWGDIAGGSAAIAAPLVGGMIGANAAGSLNSGHGVIREGIYEFTDAKAGKQYVGQSQNISSRLMQHQSAGRIGSEPKITEVLGGKTMREVMEHRRIQQITGGTPARLSPNVSNKVDPIGPNRRHLLNP